MILFTKINYHLFELTKDMYKSHKRLINMIKEYIKKYSKNARENTAKILFLDNNNICAIICKGYDGR